MHLSFSWAILVVLCCCCTMTSHAMTSDKFSKKISSSGAQVCSNDSNTSPYHVFPLFAGGEMRCGIECLVSSLCAYYQFKTSTETDQCELYNRIPKRYSATRNCGGFIKLTSKPTYVVIMNRQSTISSWNLPWSSYKNGFSLADSSYWLGLERVHQLTSSASYRLRVELLCDGTWTSAEYQSFVVGDEVKTQYALSISGYAGNLGDRLNYHNGMKFSTTDKDNSGCAQIYGGGGWWYRTCWECCLTCSSAYWSCTASVSRMSIILNP